MRRVIVTLTILLVLSTCKKEDDPTVVVNASVADSSMGSIDFKAGSYAVGEAVTFSATPQTGYTFVSWTDSSTNQTYSNNPLTLNPDQNTNLVANFEKTAYNININVIGNGEVQKQVVGGGTSLTHGATVELTAVPADQYSFFYWDNDPSDTTNPKTITLDGNKDVSAKFDYEVAKNLVGDWEFEIGGDSSSRNVTLIRMSVDIRLNVLMTTIVNGVMISQVFSQLVAISATSIVIGDFAVMTNVVVASPTSLSMSMVTLPENTPAPTKESEIPDNATPLNLSGKKSEEAPQKDESGIIIPPTEATTSSSTTEDIGSVFADSINQIADTQSSTVASETGSSTSTLSGQSFLDRVNGRMFSSVKNEYTAVFTFTNDLQGEFVKFSMIYDDCSETLINGSNIGEITKNTENELWFTFSIDPQNSDSARGETLHTAKLSFEDRSGTSSDQDNNDIIINVNIALNSDGSELKAVSLSINPVEDGARNNLNLQISSNVCNATIIDGESISGGNRRIEQNVCLGENIQSYNLQFNKLRGFDSLINTPLGTGNLAPLPSLLSVRINFKDGSVGTRQNAGTYSNYYGIEYKCNVDNSAINSDNDGQDCDISDPVWGSSGKLSYIYTGVITDTTVSSIHHTIQYGEGIISFVTKVKPESECNSPTTDTTTSTTGTTTPTGGGGGNTGTTTSTGSGGGGNTGTTSSTGSGGGNNSGTTTSTSSLIYFENGTCKCPNASVGDTATISGTLYTVVDNSTIGGQIANENYNLCTTPVTSMSNLFKANDTFNSDIGFWDTSNVTNMFAMFDGFSTDNIFNQDIGNWDTSSVTNMKKMFHNCPPFNQNIGNWDVSSVTDMEDMFDSAQGAFNQNIGNWDVSNVTNMRNIFGEQITFNQNISSWDVSSVTNMQDMFSGARAFNQNIGVWNVSSVTNMRQMFSNATAFNQDISNWNVSNVTDMYGMFGSASSFNIDIGNWNVSKVSNMGNMFYTTIFNQDIGNWNVSNVTTMFRMFWRATSFNQDIGNWNTSNVVDMGNMFWDATSFNQDIGNWNVSNAALHGMFEGASSFNQDLSSWCVSGITSPPSSFSNGSSLSNSSIPVWGTCSTTFNINVSASNASDYTLSGTDRSGAVSGNDPTVTIKVGDTLNFAVNASGHPFYLKTVQGTGTANTINGVTNNGTTNGTVSWTPTQAGTYYYICSLHAGMVGTITVN